MKKRLKLILNCVIVFSTTLVSILSVVVFSKYFTKNYFKTILNGNDSHTNIYILGNGSSLTSFLDEKKTDMPEHIMVVNYFATAPQFKLLKPKHYIMLDNNLCIKANEGNLSSQQKLIKALLEVDWKLNLYTPADSDPSLIQEFRKNININLVLYNRTPVDGYKFITHKLYDWCLGMPRPQNVSNAAVFCAIAAGFKLIYLYGVEHSWTKTFDVDPETHRIFLNDGHFYEKENKRYLPQGEYVRWLKYISMALKSHYELRFYADRCQVKIINKTKQSFIEAYDYD